MVCISSSSVVSRFIATTKPWISSVTSAPTRCAPRSWPLFLSKITFAMPWSSPSATALPLPTKGKRPTRISLVELHHLGAGRDPDALLLERLARECGYLGVLDRHDLRQHLDDGHVGTHGAVEPRKLDDDPSQADERHRLRHPGEIHHLDVVPYQLLV